MYLMQTGQVRLYQLRTSGADVTTAVLGPGQWFGVAPLFGRSTHHTFAPTVTEAEVWVVPTNPGVHEFAQSPALLMATLQSLVGRFVLTSSLLGDVPLRRVSERVPSVLQRLRPCLGGEAPCVSREVMAALVGARPETIIRTSLGPRARARPAA
jgi:CRP-like cAMP-binding protein